MSLVISWPSVELLHHVVKTLNHVANLPESEGGKSLPVVTYRRKLKLHGTNCAVQVLPPPPESQGSLGVLVAQSRTTVLTPDGGDLHGFAKWVNARGLGNSKGDHWAYFACLQHGITIFGEWAGQGVESGMAVSQLAEKVFAVFAIQVGTGVDARVVYEPEDILSYLHGSAGFMPSNMHVLPWEGESLSLDFASEAHLNTVVPVLNALVHTVEKEDPWVKRTFGVSGLGEGLVFYPEGLSGTLAPEALAQLMFKAKGEKHRTAGTKEAVQVAPEVVASVGAFVTLMVTEARLLQGLSTVGARDPKLTGKFLQWVSGDTLKESTMELEASGLTWAQVEKAVQVRAREWFLTKL